MLLGVRLRRLQRGRWAGLVDSWAPTVVTLGDNSYPESTPATIDETIGKYYAKYIHPYRGKYGPGSPTPRFFACLGNHDWQSGSIQAHLDYFDLPGNERYWQLQRGPVRFFCLDSDAKEPDGVTAGSAQGQWLQRELGAARDPYRIVVLHHPPHSSGQHGSQPTMQWPFREWGASAVYAGHDHDYERFDFGLGTIPYVVQGLGGADLRPMNASRPGSVVAYSEKHGATLVEADAHYARFAALTIGKDRIARRRVRRGGRPRDGRSSARGPVGTDDAALAAGGRPRRSMPAREVRERAAGLGQPGTATTVARVCPLRPRGLHRRRPDDLRPRRRVGAARRRRGRVRERRGGRPV